MIDPVTISPSLIFELPRSVVTVFGMVTVGLLILSLVTILQQGIRTWFERREKVSNGDLRRRNDEQIDLLMRDIAITHDILKEIKEIAKNQIDFNQEQIKLYQEHNIMEVEYREKVLNKLDNLSYRLDFINKVKI